MQIAAPKMLCARVDEKIEDDEIKKQQTEVYFHVGFQIKFHLKALAATRELTLNIVCMHA